MKWLHFIWQDLDWPKVHYENGRVGTEVALARRA